MTRITDILTAGYVTNRHCADPACPKCIARARWYRRKGWRTAKTQIRKDNGKR